MAIVSLNTIKNWFKTGLKPSQNQFWDTWDSFRHKSDKVPAAEVDGLDTFLLAKADTDSLNNHINDGNAHSALFINKVDKLQGSRLINSEEVIVVSKQSGTNTGDETATSIITKIGDGTKINQAYLPSYVDDVIEGYLSSGIFYTSAALTTAITGESGKIYVDLSNGQTSRQYRWTGTAYLQITNGLIASTNDVPEGSNLYFTTARVLATLLSGLSVVTGGTIVSTDSVLLAFGKLQKQISDNITAIGFKQNMLVSGTNIKTINGATILGSGDISITAGAAAEPSQITITTTVSITTATTDSSGKTQSGKNVVIDNGVNAINITVNGGTDFVVSYLKHGTGAITFVQASGRTLALVDGVAVLNGSVGSTATISSIGTKDYLRISNV